MIRSRRRLHSGFSLLECVFALAVVACFFSGLYGLNSQCLLTLNAGREALAAQQCLRDRVEQLRSCTWAQITDANYLKNNILCSSADSTVNLASPSETVTVNAYPTTISPPIKITRVNGVATTVTSNAAMASQELVSVQVSLSWTGARGRRARTQSTTSVIAKVQ